MTLFRFCLARDIPLAGSAQSDPPTSPAEQEVVSLFGQLRVPVLRYVLSRAVPVPDAEEIVQEVFLLFFQHLRRGQPVPSPAGWIFRTAHHFVLKHRDSARQNAEYFDASHPAPDAIADLSVRPDAALQESQRRLALLAVVRALPEQDQKCLHLRAEGLRYREIAQILGISLGAVANSLQRSIARIGRADER